MPSSLLSSTLNDLRSQLHRAVTVRLVWQLAACCLALFWIALLLDRWFEPSSTVRVTVWIAVAIALAIWLVKFLVPRVFATVSDRQLASLLAKQHPELADAVFTSLDLAGKSSPLAAATSLQAENALSEIGAVRIVRSQWSFTSVSFALVTLIAALVMAVSLPDEMFFFAKRLALSQELWPRQVRLVAAGFEKDQLTGQWNRTVVRGESSDLIVWADLSKDHVAPRSVWVQYRTSEGQRKTEALTRVGNPVDQRQEYRLRLEEVNRALSLRISGGDCRLPQLWLRPTSRPTLTDLNLECTPPSYLDLERFVTPASAARSLPEGSIVKITGLSSQPLSAVGAQCRPLFGELQQAIQRQGELLGNKGNFSLLLPALSTSTQVQIELIDKHQITNAPPFELPIDVTADEPPAISLRLAGIGRVATRDARLRLVAMINDDHRIEAVRLQMVPEPQGDREVETPGDIVMSIQGPLPQSVQLEADLLTLRSQAKGQRMSLQPGDQLMLQASVTDLYDLGPRDPSLSEPVRIEIVTRDELFARVGQREVELRRTLEDVLAEARRLAYAVDLRQRQPMTEATQERAEQVLRDWASQRDVEVRKIQSGVLTVSKQVVLLREQVLNNRLDKPSLVLRLQNEVADPLVAIAEGPLTRLKKNLAQCTDQKILALASENASATVSRLEAVLELLESRETYNEVVAMLRGLIRDQKSINDRTKREQRAEARRLLLD